MKQCNKCGEHKELSEFTKDKKCTDGTTNICKVCTNLRRKAYRKANPAQVASMYATNKIWKANNRDKVLEQARHSYQERTVEQKAEAAKRYKKSTKGKIATAVYNTKRQNGIRATSDGTITSKALTDLLMEQDSKCVYCKCTLDKSIPFSVHLDHVIPVSKGGLHSLTNVVWSCAKCNLEKGDKLL